MILLFILILFILLWLAYGSFWKSSNGSETREDQSLDVNIIPDLQQHVSFYRALNPEEKKVFEEEVHEFLSKVKIVGVDTEITDLDRILVATSAVIPLFAFREWFYRNISVVEIYRDAFNANFETNGSNRKILGMVGGGVMNGRMSLSQKALRMGFSNETDKRNTAIHEFVHLLDMTDGSADGVPTLLLDKHMSLPWLELIREGIEKIRKNESDLDDYGGTNEAEFFAVAAEYFFERPEMMKQKNPQLYELMVKAFRRVPELDSDSKIQIPGRNDLCWCGSGKKYKKCHGNISMEQS
ncbi:MAG: zinc-dependent peptidase [Flavobacteriales bacterium]|nr:zinc-dependent peptidase [Flavobacteriales bacterium]